MSLLSVSEAKTGSIQEIIRLQSQIWEPTYRHILSKDQIDFMFEALYSAESLRNQMEDLGHSFLILKRDQKNIGFSSYYKVEKGITKLVKIYVLPSEQRTGSGRYLLRKVEEIAVIEGSNQLILNVNKFNSAVGFYQKMGFQILREEDSPIGPYWMNDFVMGKAITRISSIAAS